MWEWRLNNSALEDPTCKPYSLGRKYTSSFLFVCFLNPYLRILLLIWGERQRERDMGERNIVAEKNMELFTCCLPYAPQPGIKPTSFWCTGGLTNQPSHPARACMPSFYSRALLLFYGSCSISRMWFNSMLSANVGHLEQVQPARQSSEGPKLTGTLW